MVLVANLTVPGVPLWHICFSLYWFHSSILYDQLQSPFHLISLRQNFSESKSKYVDGLNNYWSMKKLITVSSYYFCAANFWHPLSNQVSFQRFDLEISFQCSDKLGLSLELGSFMAGVMISTTDFAQHTLDQVLLGLICRFCQFGCQKKVTSDKMHLYIAGGTNP